jgi:hypothetical protein
MTKRKLFFLKFSFILTCYIFISSSAFSQVELEPWGNLAGIRIDGQLMEVESNLSVVKNDWANIKSTGKERQRPHYQRKGNQQIVTTNIDSLFFSETVFDSGKGRAIVNIKVQSHAGASSTGIYYSIFLPDGVFGSGSSNINQSKRFNLKEPIDILKKYFETPTREVQFHSVNEDIILNFYEPTQLIIKRYQTQSGKGLQLFIPILTGDVQNGQVAMKNFSLQVSGAIDKTPVSLQLNTSKPGRPFIGFGGNFRLQNPRTDPQVIDYCLKNLDVRFSRVEMPWQLWQPDLNEDPIANAKAGNLNLHVQKSMEMAQRLYKMGIPVILSAWSAPAWAVVGKPKYGPSPDGIWGNPLDSTKSKEIYKSIADYIFYLKEKYGVEVSLFSFNESDLGINIRQTGEEHDKLIKGLGAYFVSRGLKTKMLLGDNSDATTYQFIYPALNDPATRPYIGAISFHSWRGWDKQTLQKWADAATQLNKPLIVAEGSIDAQAWGYPQLFLEPSYALKEINLYVRLLSICQPESILQWQLTADYSLLAGGGIFGDTTKLRPTQRFWNMKQLSSTPENLKAIPISGNAKDISIAALGDNEKGIYAIHLVNNGAAREITIKGIPKNILQFKIFVTDKNRNMQQEKSVRVKNGEVTFILNQASFTSLFSK